MILALFCAQTAALTENYNRQGPLSPASGDTPAAFGAKLDRHWCAALR
jgi:hypothetical protein